MKRDPPGRAEERSQAIHTHGPRDLGIVMGGGGARAAYQIGFLRFLAKHFPEIGRAHV